MSNYFNINSLIKYTGYCKAPNFIVQYFHNFIIIKLWNYYEYLGQLRCPVCVDTMTQLIYSSILRHLCCHLKLFYHALMACCHAKCRQQWLLQVKEVMASNSYINCKWVVCISFASEYFILCWNPPSLYTQYSLTYKWNWISKPFHHVFTASVQRGSPLLTSAYVSWKLQCKLLWKFFVRIFCLTEFIDFYNILTLKIWHHTIYMTIWCDHLLRYNLH